MGLFSEINNIFIIEIKPKMWTTHMKIILDIFHVSEISELYLRAPVIFFSFLVCTLLLLFVKSILLKYN